MSSSSTPVYFQTMSPASSSTASASQPTAPQPSALPPSSDTSQLPQREKTTPDATHSAKVKPDRKPLLRLELRDLSDDGTRAFLRLLHATTALQDAVDAVFKHLYTGLEPHCIPPTRSITLVLRSMDGVAYTAGRDIDEDHKEIHLSTDYINQVPDSRKKEEIQGVIVHEMVHCWQHNALGTAPGGLIEGIADWVRLKAGFAPPHWKRTADCKWDAGYERTAFFLEWLEAEYGAEIVRTINDGLRDCKYDSLPFWHKCCGKCVTRLWNLYKGTVFESDLHQKWPGTN